MGKIKVGLTPTKCSSCLDLRSLPRTLRLEIALHLVLDKVNRRKQTCQRHSLLAFLPNWDPTPPTPSNHYPDPWP